MMMMMMMMKMMMKMMIFHIHSHYCDAARMMITMTAARVALLSGGVDTQYYESDSRLHNMT
jgi:hypothetical protein